MLYLITGGSGSGKSAFAERLAVQLHSQQSDSVLYYIATMHSYDAESDRRIEKHRSMRAGKGFQTIEQETFLDCSEVLKDKIDESGTYLLEDLSNLLANEMYTGRYQENFKISIGVFELFNVLSGMNQKMKNLIIVTNEIFSDGNFYDEETLNYMKQLGYLNQRLAKVADGVIEVVAGIPVWQKGTSEC